MAVNTVGGTGITLLPRNETPRGGKTHFRRTVRATFSDGSRPEVDLNELRIAEAVANAVFDECATRAHRGEPSMRWCVPIGRIVERALLREKP